MVEHVVFFAPKLHCSWVFGVHHFVFSLFSLFGYRFVLSIQQVHGKQLLFDHFREFFNLKKNNKKDFDTLPALEL